MSLEPPLLADVGNSRLKWGRIDSRGTLLDRLSLPLDDPSAWKVAAESWGLTGAETWAIASVNSARTAGFRRFLGDPEDVRVFRSAADVPVRHRLAHPETAGADRALAALAAIRRKPEGRAVLVVSCGTAVTVERIDASGLWQGGVIAPGLGLASKSLHDGTAQLPKVVVDRPPASWGDSTAPAIAAGVFWGTVGAVREILARQELDLADPVHLWTGGDAPILAPAVEGDSAEIVPDLVLMGLAEAIRP